MLSQRQANGCHHGNCGLNCGGLPHASQNCNGSPNYSLKPYVQTAAQAQMDFTPADFLDGLEQASAPVVNGQTLTTCTAVAIACVEDTGAFNTVDLFWNRAAYALEVYALAVYRAA